MNKMMKLFFSLAILVGLLIDSSLATITCYDDLDTSTTPATGCGICSITYDATTFKVTDRTCESSATTTCPTSGNKLCCTSNNCNTGTIAKCYTGSGLSSNALSGSTSSLCADATALFCKNTVPSGTITTRACATTCTPSATELCCTTPNCNDAIDLGSSCIQSGTTTVTFVCAAASPICSIVFTAAGDVSTKYCEKECTPSALKACCTGNDCNTATSLNKCYLCSSDSDCSAQTISKACSATGVKGCKTVYTGGKATAKTCETTLAKSTLTDEYCATDSCNYETSLLKCYTCSTETGCLTATSSTCGAKVDEVCKTTFSNGKAQTKTCVNGGDCIEDSQTTTCCSEDNCNTKNTVLSCYVCDTASGCNSTTTTTQCALQNSVCKTSFKNGVAVSKSCANSTGCEASSFSSDVTTCCSTDGCNSDTFAKYCFQCTTESQCNTTNIGSKCSDSNAKYCQTVFNNQRATSKSCVSTCEAGALCCQDDNCNSGKVTSGASSFRTALSTSSQVFILFTSIILSFSKYYHF